MDRSKQLSGTRGPKAKIAQQPPDLFIALGSKQSSPRDDPKRTVPLPKPTINAHLPTSSNKDKLKREASTSSLTTVPSKKIKPSLPASRPGLPATSLLVIDRLGPSQIGAEPWEALAIDSESTELFENIMNNVQTGNTDRAVGYILGVIKSLKPHRGKLCKVVYCSLFLACSCKPSLFCNDLIVNAMVSILRRDVTAGVKGSNKSNIYVHMLYVNLLTHAFVEVLDWPELFVKLYVEDAVADRVFIDNPYCKPFVDNIITAFNTKSPPSSLLKSEIWSSAARDTSSPLTINSVDDDEAYSEHKAIVDTWPIKVYPRFTQSQESVEQIVLEAIKEQLARRQQPENITKNFVRFLSTACGLVEIRIIAVSRIETWLHNHKLMKPAQELLAYLCYNCSANTQRDLEVIAQLSRLRLKNKPMLNFFNNCLREMVFSFPENLYPLLKYTIYNELSNSRNVNNLIVVGALFQVAPEASASAFADICLELLFNKDDYLRSLRALLKEINRVLRHDFNLLNVVHSLLRERKDFSNSVRDHEFRERIFLSLADLSCMCMLLCVSPQVRDAATQSKRDVSVLNAFQTQVSNIQRECVTWLHDSAMRVYRPNENDFHHVLLKILFLEQAEHYYKIDSWPGENERNLFLRLASEVPLLQASLVRILLIGISKEYKVKPTEIIEITEQLIKRAANLPTDCAAPLVVDKLEIIDFFYNLCSYNYPENITLPVGYVPPKLAITVLYWKVCLILLILAAHNPLSFGSLVWDKYPILRMFMEMCITNHFSFPPPTMNSLEDDYQVKEQQIITLEKQKILELECYLAAASTKVEINEQTSLLLSQLLELRPQGDARRPPQQVLDQLQNLNKTHRMGHLLCRSRSPDFLLDIMSRQGGGAHMPWLAELVHSSEGALAHLPVQCLCEYLLSTAPTEKLTKHGQLLAHLRTVVNGADAQMACEVLEYLFRRLTSDFSASRSQATKALNLILAPNEDVEVTSNENHTLWLMTYIKAFPHFATIKLTLVQFLRQALQIETNPIRVSSYINFLATQDCHEFADLNDLVTDLSSVIIERHSVASYVIPGEQYLTLQNLLQIFYVYTLKAKEFAEETYSYTTEYVIVLFPTGEQVAMQPLVIHAAIVLLTYGPLNAFEPFQQLLDIWFPINSDHPRAYLPETSESTSYLPDWMKLRMIRSNVERLVDAAIEKLEPPKLVLFIQSFGIPTNSISKLLHTLDKATLVDPKLVVDNVLDKTYMIQLVDVQNKRGAVGGETFVKAIEMQMPVIEDTHIQVEVELKKPLPVGRMKSSNLIANDAEILEMLNNLFCGNLVEDKNNIILSLIKSITFRKDAVDVIFVYMQSIPIAITLQIVAHYNSFSTLVRLIFQSDKDSCDREKVAYATRLWNCIANKNDNCTAAILKMYLKENNQQTSLLQKETDESKLLQSKSNLSEKLAYALNQDKEKTGLLVDWLTAIELEIADSDQSKLQMDLLFSKRSLPFRPLLMSLVLQRASWKSLHSIISYILLENDSEICPISALDFFTALTQSPRLWQGRDKAIPKHHVSEDVLKLNKDQALKLVKFVLEEATTAGETWQKQMESRLHLLLKTVVKSATFVAKYLLEQSESSIFARELLLLVYMSLPFSCQDEIDINKEMTLEIYNKNCPSAVDEISHCLLSALAATPRNKDWSRKSHDLDFCTRKLAATHPVLVLRQLTMLAGCLKGRAQYDMNVLKSRGHLMLFGQILGVVELLQPYIFEQPLLLYDIFDSYFLLMQFHGNNKDLTFLITRVVSFIQKWMVRDVKAASKYLQEHGAVLNDIQFNQPVVRPLLSNVSLPTSDQATGELLVGTVTAVVVETFPQHWPQLLSALQSPENLHALQELDHLTSKKPVLLETVSQHLYNSISSPNSAIRSLALLLVIRWLKFNPKAADEALPAVLASLDSNNGDIVNSVLDRIDALVTVMQEYAKVILTRVFQLGTKSTLATTSNITKSINLLNLQYGC